MTTPTPEAAAKALVEQWQMICREANLSPKQGYASLGDLIEHALYAERRATWKAAATYVEGLIEHGNGIDTGRIWRNEMALVISREFRARAAEDMP